MIQVIKRGSLIFKAVLVMTIALVWTSCKDRAGQDQISEKYQTSDFVGSWVAQVTNSPGAVAQCEMTLRPDQQFELTIAFAGKQAREPFRSSGSWKVAGESLITIAAKSSDPNEVNKEVAHRVTALTPDKLTYTTNKRVWRWHRRS